MEPFVSTIEIRRAPDDVFRYATDPTRFAEWQPDVVAVHITGTGPLGVGARFTTVRRIGRTERTLVQEITEVSPPRRWAARGINGPVRPNASITIEPIDGGSHSRVTFSLDFEGHGLGVALLPLVRRAAREGAPMSYQNLKNLLEKGEPA